MEVVVSASIFLVSCEDLYFIGCGCVYMGEIVDKAKEEERENVCVCVCVCVRVRARVCVS